MILYLLKSALCLLIFLLVHRLIFQREAIYQFNRFYLLGAVIGSFFIPLVELEIAPEKIDILQEASQQKAYSSDFQSESDLALASNSVSVLESEAKSFDWELIFWSVYGLITLVFLIRFLRNIHLLLDKIKRNIHVRYRDETLVLLKEPSLPFSFLSYIFISKDYFEAQQLTDAIFAHEKAHVQGKHSWDNLLIEALLVPFWFHPGLYLARQAIKLNHEFIADEAALQVTPLDQYKSFLLTMMLPGQSVGLASSLNFSLTKKRFEMMKRKTTNPTKWIKMLFVLPVLAAMVYFFSEKVTAQSEDKKNEKVAIGIKETAPVDKKETNILLRTDGKIEVDGQIIEVGQLAELIDSENNFNKTAHISAQSDVEMGFLADVKEILREKGIRRVVYQSQTTSEQDSKVEDEKAEFYRNAVILIEDENMEYTHKTYYQLTEKEKIGLLGPMRPSAKSYPDPTLFESWKDKETFALWIDGVVSANEKLEDFDASDFVFFYQSSVKSNARSERFPQPYQVHLYSDSYYDLQFGPNSEGRRPLTNRDTITLTQRMVTWNHDISRNPDPNTAYLQKNARYEKLRKSGKTFNQNEIDELNQLYRELKEEYTKSSDKRKKSLKQPIPPETKTESQIPISTNSVSPQTSLSTYHELNGAYQLKLNESRLFAKKSELEIEKLFEMFTILQDQHMFLSFEDKRIIQRPSFPYARLEKDGKMIFKRFEDLTEEERKTLNC